MSYAPYKNNLLPFDLAFDAATNHEDSFIDGLRATVNAKIINLHLLAFQVHDSHTGLLYCNTVSKDFTAICGEMWKTKMVSVATDGAKNMTRRLQGSVTYFEQACLSGFNRT